jgi:hypothetical protein
MKLFLILALFTTGVLIDANAGQIKIRLAEAFNADSPKVSSQLSDVLPLLKRNLGFNSYTLHGSTSVQTPANKKTAMNGYEVLCNGDDKKMQVTILKGGKSILKSNVIFKGSNPVIIGGLKGSKGKIFFIFSK